MVSLLPIAPPPHLVPQSHLQSWFRHSPHPRPTPWCRGGGFRRCPRATHLPPTTNLSKPVFRTPHLGILVRRRCRRLRSKRAEGTHVSTSQRSSSAAGAGSGGTTIGATGANPWDTDSNPRAFNRFLACLPRQRSRRVSQAIGSMFDQLISGGLHSHTMTNMLT